MLFKTCLVVFFMLFMTACGAQGPQGAQGPGGTPQATVQSSLEGYYVLPNGGYADIYQDAEGMYTVRQLRLVVINADGSSGLIPVANTASLPLTNGMLYSNSSPAYVAATNNVKQDSNNVQLASAYLTELMISHSGSGIQISVTVNATNGVLFNHQVVSQ